MKPICVVSCITQCHGHGQKLPLSLKRKHLESKKKHWQTEMPSVTHVPSILLICLFEVEPNKKMATETSSCECEGAKILVVWSLQNSKTPAIWEYSPTAKWYHQTCIIRKNSIGFEKAPHKAQTSCCFSFNDCHNLMNVGFVTTAQGPMALIVF